MEKNARVDAENARGDVWEARARVGATQKNVELTMRTRWTMPRSTRLREKKLKPGRERRARFDAAEKARVD